VGQGPPGELLGLLRSECSLAALTPTAATQRYLRLASRVVTDISDGQS
jgi:hypothetical protein